MAPLLSQLFSLRKTKVRLWLASKLYDGRDLVQHFAPPKTGLIVDTPAVFVEGGNVHASQCMDNLWSFNVPPHSPVLAFNQVIMRGPAGHLLRRSP